MGRWDRVIRCLHCGVSLYDDANACYHCGWLISAGPDEPDSAPRAGSALHVGDTQISADSPSEVSPVKSLRVDLTVILTVLAGIVISYFVIGFLYLESALLEGLFFFLGLGFTLAGGVLAGGIRFSSRRVMLYEEGATRLARDSMRRFGETYGLAALLFLLGLGSFALLAAVLSHLEFIVIDTLAARVAVFVALVALVAFIVYRWAVRELRKCLPAVRRPW